MATKKFRMFFAIFVITMGSIACGLLPASEPTPPDPGVIHTQAAQTVMAQLTAMGANYTATPTMGFASETPAVSSDTPAATLTASPSETPPPSATPVPPTSTPVPPTPTATPIPCNWAKFEEDVTVKDGTVFAPLSVFTKTWRLRNIGTCTWSSEYDLVFDSGDRMSAPRVVDISRSVRPGETIDVSVELISPGAEGRYRGYWLLTNESGQRFGLGSEARGRIWAEIKVVASEKYIYDFGANYCAARWYSEIGRLLCPGEKGDPDGFALLLDRPEVEFDTLENEAALWTNPQDKVDGWIMGEYPEFRVEQGHQFRTVAGCLSDSPKCDVIFQLNYRIDGGELQTLWQTREVYDDYTSNVSIDLSPLAGQKVQFVLAVRANGSPAEDRAFWLLPRIEK